jgi:hypothetical protein
MSAYV